MLRDGAVIFKGRGEFIAYLKLPCSLCYIPIKQVY